MRPEYNIHFINRDHILIDSTQEEMINFTKDEIMSLPIQDFFPAATAIPAMVAIDSVFESCLPLWHGYSMGDYSFLCLIEKIDKKTVAVHEVIDDPDNRESLKRFLMTASGNFYNQYYKESVE